MMRKSQYLNDPIQWMRETVRDGGLETMFPERFYGIYRAIVVDTEDPEERGRCRVQVPCIGQWTEDAVPLGIWATVLGATVGASNQLHGTFWPLDKGDQVMVAFEGGEFTSPVIMGGWVRVDDKPLNGAAPGKPITSTVTEEQSVRTKDGSRKALRTKSGHTLEFNDSEDGTIVISRGSGGEDGAPSGDVIVIKGNQITITNSTGNVVTVGESTITAVAEDGSTMSVGDGAAELKNAQGASVTLNGANIDISAPATMTLTAAELNLKGAVTNVGSGPAYEPMVLGNTFGVTWATHLHNASAPGAPTSTPLPTPNLTTFTGLSPTVKVSW